MECYFDNAATTRCFSEAAELMMEVLTKDYGNPSSLHGKGVAAENYVKKARAQIAKTLKCKDKEICFTSGGTESNNLALFGAAEANRRSGRHIVTTTIEHASVANPMKRLEGEGFELTLLPVDSAGIVSLTALEESIREDTILVSIMQVNNEIGAIQPIAEAGRLIKEKNPRTLFHVDAIQSYGKLRIFPDKMKVDLLSASGHKIQGPKGSGFLYIKERTKLKPIVEGGGQQGGFRSGTENVPAIAGLGLAAERCYADLDSRVGHLVELRERFAAGAAELDGVHLNGEAGICAPHIVSVSVKGVRAEVFLHALEERDIYVSAGSACSSNKPKASATLQAIGLAPELLDSTVRFSFSPENTAEEIDYALDVMRELIPALRRFFKR